MTKMDNPKNFIEYIGKFLPKEKTKEFFTQQNVKVEQTDLFIDFTITLLSILHDSYLGDDTITNDTDRYSHFNWIWKQTISQYKKEKIKFKEEGYHKDYFWYFLHENFYVTKDKDKIVIGMKEFFRSVLDITKEKTMSDLDNMKIIYDVLRNNLENKLS
jgi:hypothetical protein